MLRSFEYALSLLVLFVYIQNSHGWWWATRHCKVSGWGPVSKCSRGCGLGTMQRHRKILQYHRGSGDKCPNVTETVKCMIKPCPIDCAWGEWSQWSQCEPCSGGTRSRYRTVANPAFYDGKPCEGSDIVTDYMCEANETCAWPFQRTCALTDHTCAHSKECLNERLLCNGDRDCHGGSDERNCANSTTPPCSEATPLHNVDILGAGYDIINDRTAGHILDNNKYNGVCETLYLGEFGKRFRKPYNVQMYRGQVRADTVLHTHSYANALSLTETKERRYSRKLSGGISFNFGAAFSASAKAALSEEHMWRKVIHKSDKDDYKYFKLESKIQVAHFRMKKNDLKLSHYFKRRVAQLPRSYDYAIYRQFLHDFGTHYYTTGSLGGIFEVILQYRRKDLELSNLTDEQQRHCLSVESSFSLYGGKPDSTSEYCRNNTLSNQHKHRFLSAAVESLGLVRGGTSKTAAVLTFLNQNVTHEKFTAWAESIKTNPAIIDFEIASVATLIADDTIKLNVERAGLELFSKYDPIVCREGNCRNGGRFVVTDGGKSCKCLCATGYYNTACLLKDKFHHTASFEKFKV